MKKYWFCEKPAILVEAEKAQSKFHPILVMIIYLVFGVILMNFINIIVVSAHPHAPLIDPDMRMMRIRMITTLLYFIPFSLCLFFVRFIEKRSWASLGFVKNKVMSIYMVLIGVIVIGIMFMYIIKKHNFTFAALDGLFITLNRFCITVTVYGFLLISLTNRMSMRNAVIVVALLPLAYLGYAALVAYINEWDPILMSYYSHLSEIGVTEIIRSEDTYSVYTELSSNATITSMFFMAACALLLLRTSHIWSVAIFGLAGVFVTGAGAGFGLLYPYNGIVSIALAAAILCAVLFWPKKLTENQEGAGVVSQ